MLEYRHLISYVHIHTSITVTCFSGLPQPPKNCAPDRHCTGHIFCCCSFTVTAVHTYILLVCCAVPWFCTLQHIQTANPELSFTICFVQWQATLPDLAIASASKGHRAPRGLYLPTYTTLPAHAKHMSHNQSTEAHNPIAVRMLGSSCPRSAAGTHSST